MKTNFMKTILCKTFKTLSECKKQFSIKISKNDAETARSNYASFWDEFIEQYQHKSIKKHHI